MIEQLAPSLFPDLRTIRALKERSLMDADQVGPLVLRQKFNRHKRRRDTVIAEGHGGSGHHALVRNNILKAPLVFKRDAWERGALLEAI